MRKHIKHIFTLALVLHATINFSQNKANDTIKTGVIDVIKPYKPSISDAFKVKETPSLDDKTTQTKKEVKYNIFSFPVASTFTPAKGKAAVIEKAKPIKLYDNYATLGGGNYTTILGEVYLNHAINRTETVGGYISHHSSAGGIEDVLLDNNFSNSKINVNYSSQLRNLAWDVEGGFQHQIYNWYGLPDNYANNVDFANTLTVDHTFYNAYFGGHITFEDRYINTGHFFFRRFGDDQGSGENHFTALVKVDVPINDQTVSTNITFDYLGGSFNKDYITDNEINYGNFQVGMAPTYNIKQDDLTVNLGVSGYYLNNIETGESKFYIYPNITASYRLVDDVLIVFGGVTGGLLQNTYYDFATENPFVSPTLFVAPTDQQYNIEAGLKGKLSSNMSYRISGSYITDNNKALFTNNTTSLDVINAEDYAYGNSFGIVYDDVNTIAVSGELNVDVNRNFKLGLKAAYFNYTTENQIEAWNLLDIQGSLFIDYQINERWFAGANVFYVGERKDLLSINDPLEGFRAMVINLDSYFDANTHVGYHINDKISIFAKANNIANNTYERWQNFQVQGLQLLGGATFKFDF